MRLATALFVGEGSSDQPLADLVASLFLDRDVELRVSAPDLTLLTPSVGHETSRKIAAALTLFDGRPDVLVVHRDADTPGPAVRRREVAASARARAAGVPLVAIVPVRATEAWLLLDHDAIRRVAGKPGGRMTLDLPHARAVEDEADPKQVLRAALAAASESTGRRRREVVKRFPSHRRQLLERLDPSGPVTALSAFRELVADVETVAESLRGVTGA